MLLGLPGVQVEAVERESDLLAVTVSTPWRLMGCPDCGVVAASRGRRMRRLRDVPHAGARVELLWRQRGSSLIRWGVTRGGDVLDVGVEVPDDQKRQPLIDFEDLDVVQRYGVCRRTHHY